MKREEEILLTCRLHSYGCIQGICSSQLFGHIESECTRVGKNKMPPTSKFYYFFETHTLSFKIKNISKVLAKERHNKYTRKEKKDRIFKSLYPSGKVGHRRKPVELNLI